MPHSAITPVFTGMRTGLHALFVALTVLVVARAVLVPTNSTLAIIGVSVLVLVTYWFGALVIRPSRMHNRRASLSWLSILSAELLLLLWLTPEAAYLVFPLFFLYLHLLTSWKGPAATLVATVVVILALGMHSGWSVGGVIGPLVGAGVALLIGLGYGALAREGARRDALMEELLATRGQLAATERESGILAERARLAREIHDTVAQGLSSIQLLLYAAERSDPERSGVEHITLARETATTCLADVRSFIRELAPPQLDDHGLGGALRRLAASQWASDILQVTVKVSDVVDLPMYLQSALLRIAQGAVANVLQHAQASSATVTLELTDDQVNFTIADDGVGFDPTRLETEVDGGSDSFGLRATRERVDQLGGTLSIDSEPGVGTTVSVRVPREAAK